jgi:hypothetical protein
MDRPEPDPEALERCVAGATYPVTWEISSWSTQLSSDFKHALHRRAAWAYARRYLAEHGRLPGGTHHVTFTVGPHGNKGDADLEHPFRGRLEDEDRRFAAEITFPPVSPSAPAGP